MVALDDLGDGYSGLRLWSELLPDFHIKVDKRCHSIHNDRIKASFVASLHRMATASNCRIIAEGVEQPKSSRCCRRSAFRLRRARIRTTLNRTPTEIEVTRLRKLP